MITLVGAVLGVSYFGLIGLLIGPLALSYFFELIRMYREEYLEACPVKPAPNRALVFWSFAAIYVVWGSTYLAIRVLVESVPPLLSRRRPLHRRRGAFSTAGRDGAECRLPRGGSGLPPFCSGALFFLFGNGGISWAETRIPSGLTALLAATSPLFTVVFESGRSGWRRPPAPRRPRHRRGARRSGAPGGAGRDHRGRPRRPRRRRGDHARRDRVGRRLGALPRGAAALFTGARHRDEDAGWRCAPRPRRAGPRRRLPGLPGDLHARGDPGLDATSSCSEA